MITVTDRLFTKNSANSHESLVGLGTEVTAEIGGLVVEGKLKITAEEGGTVVEWLRKNI